MTDRNSTNGYLIFEDGAVFPGTELIGDSNILGEAVFNTSHTGYQEILTDPSYYRQIITFTAPHIGNTGTNDLDNESSSIQAAAAVVRTLPILPSNWRNNNDFRKYITDNNFTCLVGASTREVTLYIRNHGALRCGIFTNTVPRDEALSHVQSEPKMAGANLAQDVTCSSVYSYKFNHVEQAWHTLDNSGNGLRVAVIDFGVKENILRELACRGCEVLVYPLGTTSEKLYADGVNGVLLSNGPGDPAVVEDGVRIALDLIDSNLPVFGICLGHQLLSISAGFKTIKLPFGHRGANHPVRNELTGKVEITSQNHGFAVVGKDDPDEWQITHINLNDQTVEGLRHKAKPLFSLQYHPEASPGPHDSMGYFDQFIASMNHAS